MAQRDYAARGGSKKKKTGGVGKSALLMIAGLVVVGFVLGLYLLKEKSPEVTDIQNDVAEKAKPKSQLPSRPEETWSYIKELESRTVPTDNSTLEKSAQLSDKQKEELKRLEEAEKKAALEKALKAEEIAKAAAQSTTTNAEQPATANAESLPAASEEAALAAKAAEEKKLAEQRRKAELAKQEAAKKAEAARAAEAAKAAETAKVAEAEKAKEQAKMTETKKVEAKPASTGKFGLQCGAFNDRAKAEALQAKLAMTGLNARITESGKWNRVLVGPIGDRPAAASAQQQASSIASCVVIGM